MDFEFEKSLNKLRELYETDKSVLKKINKIIYDTGDDNVKNIAKEVQCDIFLLIVVAILIVLVGFLNISSFGLYLAGVVFFFAGMTIGLFVDVFGLIFMFSHGICGLCLMTGSLIYGILENPILTDGPLHPSIIICGVIVIGLFIAATLLGIIHNLSSTAKNNKYLKVIILFLYFLGFLITGLYVHFFPIIY